MDFNYKQYSVLEYIQHAVKNQSTGKNLLLGAHDHEVDVDLDGYQILGDGKFTSIDYPKISIGLTSNKGKLKTGFVYEPLMMAGVYKPNFKFINLEYNTQKQKKIYSFFKDWTTITCNNLVKMYEKEKVINHFTKVKVVEKYNQDNTINRFMINVYNVTDAITISETYENEKCVHFLMSRRSKANGLLLLELKKHKGVNKLFINDYVSDCRIFILDGVEECSLESLFDSNAMFEFNLVADSDEHDSVYLTIDRFIESLKLFDETPLIKRIVKILEDLL